MTTTQLENIKKKISDVLSRNLKTSPSQVYPILPDAGSFSVPASINYLQGKLYEASVLAEICRKLVVEEKLSLKLINNNIKLKQKGGPINRKFPYIEAYMGTNSIGEIWTDIEFLTISHERKKTRHINHGDYHELDIAFLNINCSNRPSYKEVKIAIECKNTKLEKKIIRELLGFRRELCLLSNNNPTGFKSFPISMVPAAPPSVHMLYCRDPQITSYQLNCNVYGILLNEHNM